MSSARPEQLYEIRVLLKNYVRHATPPIIIKIDLH